MANRDRSDDVEGWPYRFDERDGSVDRYAGGTRGNDRDDYQGSGAYGGSYTAGGRTGAGFGGGYYGYPRGRADRVDDAGRADRADRDAQREETANEPRPGFVAGFGGNVGGYGRGGALDYGYGGMNVGGRDRDWGLGDVPHLPNERYGGRWAESRDEAGVYGRAWGGPPDVGRRDRVRRDHSGFGPRGYRRSDVRINEEVCDVLTDSSELDASEIEVRVESGEVTLSGSVPDRYSKRLAEDLADTVPGVWDVQNRLKILAPEGEAHGRAARRENDGGEDAVEPAEDAEASPSTAPRRKRR